jgi:hypothetical protein
MDRRGGFAQGSSANPFDLDDHVPAAIGNGDAEGHPATRPSTRTTHQCVGVNQVVAVDHENNDQCENGNIDDQGKKDDDQG